MMIKRHKTDDKRHLYWEGWVANGDVIFHWGTVGETGERRTVSTNSEGEASQLLQRESAAMEASGFQLLDRNELVGVVVNYGLMSWGSEEDLETRHYLEDLCD